MLGPGHALAGLPRDVGERSSDRIRPDGRVREVARDLWRDDGAARPLVHEREIRCARAAAPACALEDAAHCLSQLACVVEELDARARRAWEARLGDPAGQIRRNGQSFDAPPGGIAEGREEIQRHVPESETEVTHFNTSMTGVAQPV